MKETVTKYRFTYRDEAIHHEGLRKVFRYLLIILIAHALPVILGLYFSSFLIAFGSFLSLFLFALIGVMIIVNRFKDKALSKGSAILFKNMVQITLRDGYFEIPFKEIIKLKPPQDLRIRLLIYWGDQKLLIKPPTSRIGYDRELYDLKDDSSWDNFVNALDSKFRKYQRMLVRAEAG